MNHSRFSQLGGVLIALCAFLGAASPASAIDDQVLSSARVVIRTTPGGTRLRFVARDPALTIPAPGSADDPVWTRPYPEGFSRLYLQVQLFTSQGRRATALFPALEGWRYGRSGRSIVYSGAQDRDAEFEYYPDLLTRPNSAYPWWGGAITRFTAASNKRIKVRADLSQVDLGTEPFPDLGIRVVLYDKRWCVHFDEDSIRESSADTFSAKTRVVGSLTDCRAASFGFQSPCGYADGIDSDDYHQTDTRWEAGLPVDPFGVCEGECSGGGLCVGRNRQDGQFLTSTTDCSCVMPEAPCGDTAPLCGGECPQGQYCETFQRAFGGNECACLPEQATPCSGLPGVCAGDCPQGWQCRTTTQLPDSCTCGPPNDCPAGTYREQLRGGPPLCWPAGCPGDDVYPTCGGDCGAGLECMPLDRIIGAGCLCAPPQACDEFEGYQCPAGEVCTHFLFPIVDPRPPNQCVEF